MSWPYIIYSLLYPKEKLVWIKIRILHETDKAILVYCGRNLWIPKSRVYGIRLRNSIFEISIKESTIG